jgi:hypothetical protein
MILNLKNKLNKKEHKIMKVICKKNTAQDLDLKEVTTVFSNEVEYELEIGKKYRVMGIMINKKSNCIYYLIDEKGWPDWYPYLLFEISDNTLPQDWYIGIYDKKGTGSIFMLMGFDELCNDDNYHDLLMDRDEATMKNYFRRKIGYEKTEVEQL